MLGRDGRRYGPLPRSWGKYAHRHRACEVGVLRRGTAGGPGVRRPTLSGCWPPTREADTASQQAEPPPTSGFSLSITDDVVATAKRLVGTTPVTTMPDILQAHPEASAWVQDGSKLHRDSCALTFCGGPLTGDRRAQIEKRFSDEVAQLQRG